MNARRTILLAVLAVVAACIVFVVFQQAQESSEVADAIDSTVQDATAALSSGDPSAALRMLSKAISEHPDEPQLHLLTARAYCARGRYKDALDALSKADGLELEPAQIDESKFIAGRAVAGRYLETGAPEDRKLSQADLQPLIAHSRFGGLQRCCSVAYSHANRRRQTPLLAARQSISWSLASRTPPPASGSTTSTTRSNILRP